jgi:hypothetical protein
MQRTLRVVMAWLIVLGTAAYLGAGTSPTSAVFGKQAKSCRCSPAFPGQIPQCTGTGGSDMGGTHGSGGTGGP